MSIESLCSYQILDNGVHEFVMLDFSRAGVDAFVAQIERMNASIAPDAGVAILVDSRQGTQPLNYLLGRLRKIERIATPTKHRTHVAIVLQFNVMSTIVSTMMRLLPQLNVRVFRSDQYDIAQDWLHETAQKSMK